MRPETERAPVDPAQPAETTTGSPGWDALLLSILVFAHLQISGLAESEALPNRVADVLRHPILGNLLPAAGEAAMGRAAAMSASKRRFMGYSPAIVSMHHVADTAGHRMVVGAACGPSEGVIAGR